MAYDKDDIPDPTHLGSGPTQIIHVGIAFLCLTWIAVLLRVWARGFIIRAFGWDDWTMLLIMGAFTSLCAFLIKIGLKELHPKDNVNLEAISLLITDTIAFSACYSLSAIFLKISLALFFLRIIVQPWQRNIIIYSLVIYTTFALVYFGVAVFGCGDPAKFLINTAEGKCLSVPKIVIPLSYAQTTLNAVIDWIYVMVPIYTLWHLTMPRSTKAWASLLILLGALGSVASLIRIKTVTGMDPGREFFRASTPTMIWCVIETGLGIAAGSFATLRPMFRRCIETTRTGYSNSQRSKDSAPLSDIRTNLNSKSIPLGIRSPAERAGFRPFDSPKSDFEVSLESCDPEKGGDYEFDRRYHYERNADGILVQRTMETHYDRAELVGCAITK